MAEHDVAPKKLTEVGEEPSKDDTENGSSGFYIDPIKERRMMRKFDVRVPSCGLCFLRDN